MYPESISTADQQIAERISRARELSERREEILSVLELGFLHYEKCAEFSDRPDATVEDIQTWLMEYRPDQVEDLAIFAEHLYRLTIRETSIADHTAAVVQAIHRRHGFLREVTSHLIAAAIGALIVGGLAAYLNIFGLAVGKQQWERDVTESLSAISRDLKSMGQGQK